MSATDENADEGSPAVAFFAHLREEVSTRAGGTPFLAAMQDIASRLGVSLPWEMVAAGRVVAGIHKAFVYARDQMGFDMESFFALFALREEQGKVLTVETVYASVLEEFLEGMSLHRGSGINPEIGELKFAIIAVNAVARRWVNYCEHARQRRADWVEIPPNPNYGGLGVRISM